MVEIASSSASYDLNVKLNAYRRNGVREYVVYRVLDRQIDWFVLREGEYERLSHDADGRYESQIFAGLRLDLQRFREMTRSCISSSKVSGGRGPARLPAEKTASPRVM